MRRFACFVALCLLAPGAARAQDDERAGGARGEYAWGQGGRPGDDADDPLRILGFAGVGIGFRLLRNLDPPFNQDFVAPAYLDLGGAVIFAGGDLRHGVGLTVTPNLTQDGTGGVGSFSQWALTPSYHLLIPLRRIAGMDQDMLHVQGRIGVPIVFSSALGSASGGTDIAIGAELGLAVHFKFLAGLGVYAELSAAIYGGTSNTAHPVVGADAGLLVDYEVL